MIGPIAKLDAPGPAAKRDAAAQRIGNTPPAVVRRTLDLLQEHAVMCHNGLPGSPPSLSLHLLQRSIVEGATVVGIGPFTHFVLLEQERPRDRHQPKVTAGRVEGPPQQERASRVTPARSGRTATGRADLDQGL